MKMKISVILPTHDRPASLLRAVRSVLSQSRLPAELIVVNDGSDEIAGRIRREVRRAGVGFVYRRMRRASLPASRNAGIDASGGDVLVLLDDDVELSLDFLADLAGMYEADTAGQIDGIGAVGTDLGVGAAGTDRPSPDAKRRAWTDRLWDVLMLTTAHTRWMPRRCVAMSRRLPPALRGRLKPARFLIGGRTSVRRRVVESVRFNEAFSGYAVAEDRDFSYRATQRFALFVAPSLRLIHHCESASRPDPAAWGRMMAANHIRVVADALEPGAGKWVLLGWDLAGMMLVHAAYALVGDRRFHAGMARGLLSGVARAVTKGISSGFNK